MADEPRKIGGRLLAGILVLVIVGSLGWMGVQIWALQRPAKLALTDVSGRQQLPAMRWDDISGGEWKLADQKGRVVVINYFATWCAPCRREMPSLNAIVKEFTGRDISFAAISVDTVEDLGKPLPPALKEFAIDNRMTMPILLSHAAAGTTEMRSVPTTILIDKQGRVAQAIVGPFDAPALRRVLEVLLAEK